MKRLLLLTGIFTVSCSQQPIANVVNLVGTHDLALVGEMLFVTSTDRDEIKVLDLVPPGLKAGSRQFMPAPNPLEPLSIPVLSRPSSLTKDIHYANLLDVDGGVAAALGREVAGPWLYATRSGGSEISVVAAARDQLFEVELRDGGTPLRIPTSAPVTATAAWSFAAEPCAISDECSPGQTCVEGSCSCATSMDCSGVQSCTAGECVAVSTDSRLFFATSNGDDTTLQSIDLPGTLDGLRALAISELTSRQKVIVPAAGRLIGEVVIDMVVVPGIPGQGICEAPGRPCLILATRQQQGRAGRVLLFDPQVRDYRELHFPGPVRSLAVHAGAMIQRDYFAPGRRVWGILNEEACGGPACSGITAVDTFTGEVAKEIKEDTTTTCSQPSDCPGKYGVAGDCHQGMCRYVVGPMLTISVGGSLPTGLTLVPGGMLLLPAALLIGTTVPSAVPVPVLGVVSTSNGSLLFFRADTLSQIDTDPDGPIAATVTLYGPDGLVKPTCLSAAGTCELSTDLNGANKACSSLANDCYIPGPVIDAAGNGITLANGAWPTQMLQVAVNGFIPGLVGLPTDETTDGNDFPAPSFASRAEVGDTIIALTPAGSCRVTVSAVTPTSLQAASVPSDCAGRTSFAVRAGGADPYVLTATLEGYLGRSGPNQHFAAQTPYFLHYDADYDPAQPTIQMTFGPSSPQIVEDYSWQIDIQSHFGPFLSAVDSASVGCLTVMAGSVVFDLDLQRVFTVYPSANGIIELNPAFAARGVTGINAVCYR